MHGQEALNFIENAFGFTKTMRYYDTEIKALGDKAAEYRDRSNRVYELNRVWAALEASKTGMYQSLPEYTTITVHDECCSVPTAQLVNLIEEQIRKELQCDTNPTNA